MDVYDEVDRRENDAGERRARGAERGARGAAPPPLLTPPQGQGWGGRPGAGRSSRLSPVLPPIRIRLRRDRRPLLPHSSGRGGLLGVRGRRWVPGLGCCWRWVPAPPGDGGATRRGTLGLGVGVVGGWHGNWGCHGGVGTDRDAKPSPRWLGGVQSWCYKG